MYKIVGEKKKKEGQKGMSALCLQVYIVLLVISPSLHNYIHVYDRNICHVHVQYTVYKDVPYGMDIIKLNIADVHRYIIKSIKYTGDQCTIR